MISPFTLPTDTRCPLYRTFRKILLLGLILVALSMEMRDASGIENGTQKDPTSANLQSGDFTWHPETSPSGPVVIVVDLSQQLLQVYRGGVLIGRSTVSAGKNDHPTPTGIFTILQKNVSHHSNLYHEAAMPYMERLTWHGLAIHAGNVPGHPESHGCVHVPMAFARKLYEITQRGATVLITNGGAQTPPPEKPDLEFSKKGAPDLPPTPPGQAFTWKENAAPHPDPLSIIYSSADRQMYVYRSGVEIGRCQVQEPQSGDVGNRIYAALAPTNGQGTRPWQLLGSLESSPAPDAENLLNQLGIPPDFLAKLRPAIATGTTLVMTDESVNKSAARQAGEDLLDTASQ